MTKKLVWIMVFFFSIVIVSAFTFFPPVMDEQSGVVKSGGKGFFESDWASLEVNPELAFSLKTVRNFTQALKVCNKAEDEGYLFVDYYFSNPLQESYLFAVDKGEKDILRNETLFGCENLGTSPNNVTTCFANGTYISKTRISYENKELLNDSFVGSWKDDKLYHNFIKEGTLYKASECKDYIINYKTVEGYINGKWNFKVWGNIKDDWSCIDDSSCPFSIVLDPFFSSNYSFKRNLNVSYGVTGGVINNHTLSINITNGSTFNSSHWQSDFNDTVFVNFDETTALGCYKENTTTGATASANWSVMIPNFTNTTMTSIWMYYGISGGSVGNSYCAEINSAYLLADVSNVTHTTAINSTIWNQNVGSAFGVATNNDYNSSTTAAEVCSLVSTCGGTALSKCLLLANTTGKLKQSQSYQINMITRDVGVSTGCAQGTIAGDFHTQNGMVGDSNITWANCDEGFSAYIRENTTNLATNSNNRTGYYERFLFVQNSFNGRYNYSNTSAGLANPLVQRLSGAKAYTNVFNQTAVIGISHMDVSGGAACGQASGQTGIRWVDFRMKSFINVTPSITFGSEEIVTTAGSSINITNQTYNTPVYWGELANWTVNVSWNANEVNNVSANFTYQSCAKLGSANIVNLCTVQNNTYLEPLITNSSGFVAANIKWTQFNISLRPNMTEGDGVHHSFQWNFTIDTNTSDGINSSNLTNQTVNATFAGGNYSWTTPVIEGQSNTFFFNVSKTWLSAEDFIPSYQRNMTVEYNAVNQSVGTLVGNTSSQANYSMTMSAPFVSVNTLFQHHVWINETFQGVMILSKNSNFSQMVLQIIDLNETNQTWETIGVFETGLANFSINVTIDGNVFNNISAVNFTYNGSLMRRDSQISNTSIGNWTRFNVSIRVPLAFINGSNSTFNWSFYQSGNATSIMANGTNYSQSARYAYYVNNQTFISPLVSGRLNPITVNWTKHVSTGSVVGLQINVTNEWNLTNRTATDLLTNASGYEEYNLTFRAPYVYINTSVSMKGWLNITFNGSMVVRDPNFTQVLTPLLVNATIVYEDPVLESGRANFSANVSFNGITDVNYVLANFSYDSGIAVYTTYITNTTGITAGINWTFFNLTIRPNITLMNNTFKNFQWNFTIITNTTNLTNATNLTNQSVLWSYWINNVTWTSPIFTSAINTFVFNMTKRVDDATVFIRNVTLQYNNTNLTPNATLLTNTTTFEVYNITFTAPSVTVVTLVNWTAWINTSFQSFLLARGNRTNTTIVNGTQTIVAANLTVLYSGNVSNGSLMFVRNLTSNVSFTCTGNGTLSRNINGSANASYPVTCPIGGNTFNNTYVHIQEGNFTINWSLLFGVTNISTPTVPFISDLFNPNVTLNVTSSLPFFNVSSAFNITLNCTDSMFSPLNYTKTLNSTLLFNGTLPNATIQTNLTNLVDGVNIITGTCADAFGSTTAILNITLYLKSLALIDEINNTACDVGNLTGARVYIDDNSTFFDYKFANASLINISVINFTSINTTRLRFELLYTLGATITRYIDVSFFNGTSQVRVCCNRQGITHFEQLITSAIIRPVWLKSIFSNCYVAADYTRFVFQDRKVLKAFTIQQPYYLTTIINKGQVLLSSLDGSIQTEINLDTLELLANPFEISIIQGSMSFHNAGINTTTIVYNNSANDNLNGTLVITEVATGLILFNSTMATPNAWTLVFDYTTLNLTNSSVFQATYTSFTSSGLVKTVKGYFSGRGASGLILNSIAAIVALLLLLFGLSITSARITFAWFGIVICLAAFIVLTLAVGGVWYITFLQVITAIVVVYIVINLIKQSGDVIT